MNIFRTLSLRHLGAVVCLGLSLAAAGCSEDADSTGGGTTTTTSSSSSASGSASSSTGDSTSGSTSGSMAGSSSSTGGNPEPSLSFFVSSDKSTTGNLGGLEGADKRCQDLAAAVGAGNRTWRAYLSIEHGPTDAPVHAKDRIGNGPWYNAKLAMVAADVADLHAKTGDHTVFLDENGNDINGQWANSPKPNEHDILTGSEKDGTVKVGNTCLDWTSESAADFGWVGHSDGLGPNMSMDDPYPSWNSVHANGGCNDTAPKGGAGRIYCFAAD